MVKLSDVAGRAGVSVSTVSHVLNGRGDELRITRGTQEKVYSAAKELNYRPNAAARQLRGNADAPVIALLVKPNVASTLIDNLIAALQEERNGVDYQIAVYPYASDNLKELKKVVISSAITSAIICNTSREDEKYISTIRSHVPIYLFNRKSATYDCVYVDNEGIGREVAELLFLHGHKKVGLIASELDDRSDVRRDVPFIERAAELGIEVFTRIGKRHEMGLQDGYEITREFMNTQEGRALTAIYYSYDEYALGGLRCLNEMGISIPGDMEVISYGSSNYDAFCTPSLTVFAQPIREMVREIVRMQFAVSSQPSGHREIVYKPQIVYRESFPRIAVKAY